jgi:drug/metabolite transporter (DMT)-like permease
MAIITVAIWGTTFVSTKILIQHGLSPSDIFFYRFTLAYLCMWCISYKKLFANRVKDELLLLLAGLCGGTIYFITENTALGITLASNVSLIVCTSPVLTTLLSYLFRRKEPFTRHLVYGSIMALIGVGLVVFNGSFILKINPLGDILSLTAALMWAFYCLILKQLDNHYSIVFITRKVFFYGVLTILPMFLFRPLNWDNVLMMQPIVFGNLLFLGFVASMLCFIAWNACVKELGQCLDDATHRVWKSSLFGICRLHALLHSLECMCQGIGSRKKYKLYLYRPFGNSSYFSGHY